MIMCLIHDIVEIDAGDTYAYDSDGLATQKDREDAAKERIFSILPDDQKKGDSTNQVESLSIILQGSRTSPCRMSSLCSIFEIRPSADL